MKKIAFTLAEVLITLGIIGVVAAMTIPNLLKNTGNSEYKNKLLKEYSVISQVFQQLLSENGGQFDTALSGCFSNTCLKNLFRDKLLYSKDCDLNNGGNVGICFPAQSNIKFLNTTSADASYFNNNATSGLLLNDGASLAFWRDDSTCKSSASSGYTNRCGWFTLDVNGLKAPNTWGRDLYLFFIFSDAIRPASPGVAEVTASDDCLIGTNTGFTCASKYIYGGQ